MISIEELYSIYQQCTGVTTDTRKVEKGNLFFALKGPNFNGNEFAARAMEAGAIAAIVDEPNSAISPGIYLTNDCLHTLQQLALHHRQQFNIPFMAITGSNGKTTTKELVHAVLKTSFKTYTTQGNLNNHIGIPLTLLSVKKDAELAVIEMGANHQKEIESYCTYALPTHGLITNCGKAHLEGFGGIEGVRKGKGELFDFLKAHNGVAFAASDFDYFHTMSNGLPQVHWYGTKEGEVVGQVIQSKPFLEVLIIKGFNNESTISTKLVGAYNIYNVLAAVCTGIHFGVKQEEIISAIENYEPSNSRSQLVEIGGNHIILDAYNANPSSMSAAIENFARMHVPNKILFIGGMAELGEGSLDEHKQIVQLIKRFQWKDVILVGGDFGRTDHLFRFFNNSDEAATWWQHQHLQGQYLLVKGSRSMKMENIITR